MSRETDRLIADRGHALSLQQKHVLRGIACGDIRCNPNGISGDSWWADTYRHVKKQTLRSLADRDLIRRPAWCCTETEALWELTPDGYTLARRMGIEAVPPGRELSPEDRAECAEEAQMKRLEDQ